MTMPMPPSFDSLLIVVPAYNEEAAVGGVVRAIHAAMPGTPVLVIDDCSTDATQAAAREAGAHLFSQTDCNVYANGPFVALHASQDGSVELDTGKPGEIRDALSDQVVGRGPILSLPLLRGETRVLKY